MSNITTIYNSLISMMTTVFPNKMRLSDAQISENNDEMALADGWSLYIGAGTNTNRTFDCNYSLSRDVSITLTKAFYGGHKATTILDTTSIALLEELHTLIDYNLNNQIAGTNIAFNFIGDNGLERVFGESKTFIMIKANFQVEYFENV